MNLGVLLRDLPLGELTSPEYYGASQDVSRGLHLTSSEIVLNMLNFLAESSLRDSFLRGHTQDRITSHVMLPGLKFPVLVAEISIVDL